MRAQNEPAMAQQQAMLDMLGKLLAAKIQAGASGGKRADQGGHGSGGLADG